MRFPFMYKEGGSHPDGQKKFTAAKPIVNATIPSILIYPVAMHIGAPAQPVVEVNDQVTVGQMIAKANGFISAPVYSSVSGRVIAVEKRSQAGGSESECIIIQNDYAYSEAEAITEPGRSHEMSVKEIIAAVKKAGIVGMGGATFPTAVKLSPPDESNIDTLILNGAECEPYSTSDHRVMLEYTAEVVQGISIVASLYPTVKHIYIAIEDDKKDAQQALEKATATDKRVTVQLLKTLYPQGSEKNLIKNLTGREVQPRELPADVHVVVLNVSTARAVYHACELGQPLTERIISVSGSPIRKPQNLKVKIGTPIESVIADCGGFSSQPAKVLSGGPMMGRAISDLNVPVTKGMTAVTALSAAENRLDTEEECIMCAGCLHVCPVNLQPILISEAFKRGDLIKARELGALDCIECGNCTFICPANIPLLENIRNAKITIQLEQGG